MPVPRPSTLVLLLGLLAAPLSSESAKAAEPLAQRLCLSRAEQSEAVAAKQAVPLAQVIRKIHQRGPRAEVVRVRLCRGNERLVYVLTVLPRSGRVMRVLVDASNGELITVR